MKNNKEILNKISSNIVKKDPNDTTDSREKCNEECKGNTRQTVKWPLMTKQTVREDCTEEPKVDTRQRII